MAGVLLLGTACGDDDDDSGGGGSGQATFSCGKPGEFCSEFRGSASSIDAIRDATKCTEQGSVEGTGCAKDGAVICELPKNGSSGSSGGQYYYGTEEDDIPSLKAACEAGGGTFSAP